MITQDQIEDALLAALVADATLAGYCRAFEVLYDVTEEELRKKIKLFPAIGLITDPVEYAYEMSHTAVESTFVKVLCFTKNLRSGSAALRDAPDGPPGIWTMIYDCRAAILGSTLSVEVIDCLPKGHAGLYIIDEWAVAALEVEVKWRNVIAS